MATYNVNRANPDQFYRYKMPKLVAKVEGKGNGIKTVVVNMEDIAKSLGRPPSYSTKYFGCELGAQTQMDAAKSRYVVNGSHDATKLQNLLDGFIKKFVLCQQCENPETTLRIDKQNNIFEKCAACGHKAMVDMTHKLTAFILKNPPEGSTSSKSGPKETKKEKKEKKNKKEEEAPTAEPVEVDRNGVAAPPRVVGKSKEDEDWSVDTSEEAVRARMAGLTSAAKSMALDDDVERPVNERKELLYKFALNPENKAKDIVEEAKRLDLTEKAPGILVHAFFNGNVLKQIPERRKLFLQFTARSKKAQRYLLGAIEQLIDEHQDLLPKTSLILQALYNEDYVSEEIMLAWSEKPSGKYVSKEMAGKIHEKAAKFVEWLKTAEEESDEEEDGEEEEEEEEEDEENEDDEDDAGVEIEYDENADDIKLADAAAPAAAEEEEDIDIDAI
eukprot:Colp12_sorted_trinity150504_noHs@2599